MHEFFRIMSYIFIIFGLVLCTDFVLFKPNDLDRKIRYQIRIMGVSAIVIGLILLVLF